jgi:LmbE family N-acetylglucosaminyl deacetylase
VLTARLGGDRPLGVLAVGAHPDDIEIGCGGTILRLAREGRIAWARWVVLSGSDERAAEARAAADAFLCDVPERTISLHAFRDAFFPAVWADLKETFARLAAETAPDLVFTHRLEDRHQDHRLVAELTWQAFRDHLVLEYEIPKYEGDLGAPNVFVELPEDVCRSKVEHIGTIFRSQSGHRWFDGETFWATLRLRGLEGNAATRYAEAFHARKLLLGAT